MNDEQDFEKKLQKFSIIKQCPKCKKLALSYKDYSIRCTNCSYEVEINK